MRADADQLFRVLSNLVRNAAQAIEAAGGAGAVTVAPREAAGADEIRVADTGPGLPQKARDNLFQPFRGGVRQGGAASGSSSPPSWSGARRDAGARGDRVAGLGVPHRAAGAGARRRAARARGSVSGR